jgi:putative transposase
MSDEDRPGSRALRRGRVSVVGQVYHVTSRAPSGAQPFAQRTVAGAMCRAFHRVGGQGRGRLLAWVLMPDHAHWLVELEPASSLSGLISTLKRESTKAANAIASNPKGTVLWMPGFHDRAIRSDDDLAGVARYIVANPIRAGLVARVGDYAWWNAVWI